MLISLRIKNNRELLYDTRQSLYKLQIICHKDQYDVYEQFEAGWFNHDSMIMDAIFEDAHRDRWITT